MLLRKPQAPDFAPRGSIILWLASGVLGASAGMVLLYHYVLASHAAPPAALDAAHAAARSEVLAASPHVATAHSEALKAASSEAAN